MSNTTMKRLDRLEATAFPFQWVPCHCILACSEDEANSKRTSMLASAKESEFMTILLVAGATT